MTRNNFRHNNQDHKILLACMSAVIMGLLIFLVFHINVPNPNMILITAMVFFTGIGGVIPGAVSAVLMLLYSMYFFSTNGSFFQHTEVNFQKILVIIFGIVVNFTIVALLKRNRDNAENLLRKSNKHLAEKVDTAERIAELQESVSSLLTNMPALTFSKDISNGKYLACNQSFAEYAKKDSPEGVIGLTDYEIFDKETADHFVADDQKALAMEEPYVFMEDTPDAAGNMRHFQTTKQKFTDTTGRMCILGMCMDVSELYDIKTESSKVREAYEEAKSESITFGHVAQALSSDYANLFYVDLETEEFTEFLPDPDHGELKLLRHDNDFFNAARRDAIQVIYEKDQDDFLKAFTKENILRNLREQQTFTINYRQYFENVPTYVMMKVTPMNGDTRHIVIGVRNIDSQMRAQEAAERIKEERITYDRISALTRNYIAIYTVDPETEHYLEYSGSDKYDELGITKEGEEFFKTSQKNALKTVYQEDLKKFQALFTKQNVLQEIEAHGVYSLDYRLMMEQGPVYVNLNAAMVEEKDGKQLIIGVNNINAQVKRDIEYRHNLAEAYTQANRDELTGVKNKHAYAELEEQLNKQIKEGKRPDFSVCVFDVNELKTVNDTHGHQEGDELLRSACAMICRIFAHSPVFRIRGDEFTVISQGYDYLHINELMNELEKQNRENRENGKANVAAGMAKYNGESDVAAVFKKADEMMYANKRALKMGVRD